MKIKTHLVVGARVERDDDPRPRNSRITKADQQSEPEQAVKVPASLVAMAHLTDAAVSQTTSNLPFLVAKVSLRHERQMITVTGKDD
jgi:hypothetical protein